jgi:hypothetical protein
VLFAACAVGVVAVTADAADLVKGWDFESGMDGWIAWGTSDKTPAEAAKRMVAIDNDKPQAGSACLVVRDELDNESPYAIVKVPVEASRRYRFEGWIRGADAANAAEAGIGVAAVSVVGDREEFITWLKVPEVNVGGDWTRFDVAIDKIPSRANLLYLAVRPTSHANPAAKAVVWIDDLQFFDEGARPGAVKIVGALDMRSTVNRGFRDDVADDGEGGWTDQGENDLRGIQPGRMAVSGVPFDIIDPAANHEASALVLKLAAPKGFAASATAKVDMTFDMLCLLHAAAWVGEGDPVGEVVFTYDDGTRSPPVPITAGAQLGDWWGGRAGAAKVAQLASVNPLKDKIRLFAAAIPNPFPAKKVQDVTFAIAPKAKANTMWMILAATAASADTDPFLAELAVVQRDYAGWAPFALGLRPSPKPLVDFSCLLDAPAGKHGFVKAENGHFVFADGTPARFWAMNVHANITLFPTKDQAERVATTLARYGVNLVRLHLMEYVLADPNIKDRRALVSKEQLDKFDYFIKCLKDKGIYILLDSVTGQSTGLRDFAGVVDNDKCNSHRPWSYFDPVLKARAKEYMAALLTHVNIHTGKRLADEPAVAMLTIINEQTAFFDWELAKMGESEHYASMLRRLYNEWLLANEARPRGFFRFLFGGGDPRAALAEAWTNSQGECALRPDEDPAQGTVQLASLDEIRSSGGAWTGPVSPPRIRSATLFRKSLQRSYYEEMIGFIRSLGAAQVVIGSNIVNTAAELDAQTITDATSHNVYFDHAKYGKDNATLYAGNIPAVLTDSLAGGKLIETSLAGVKLATHPMTSTESDMMWPHEWRASYMLSLASVSALQDWDAIFHYNFMGGFGHTWDTADATRIILNATVEFNDPALLGSLPAAALLFHRRDVSPARNLVQVLYSPRDLEGNATEVSGGGFPFNYLAFVSRVEGVVSGKPDRRAGLVIGADGDRGFPCDLGAKQKNGVALVASLDAAMKTQGLLRQEQGVQNGAVVSDTGEIVRDPRRGLLMVDSPRTQGFTGFPVAPVALSDVTFECRSPFATIIASSLEDRPLSQARRIFLTAVARSENGKDARQYEEIVTDPAGFKRGEGMLVVRGDVKDPDQRVMTEKVKATIRLSTHMAKGKVTPLAADFSALGDATPLAVKDGKAVVEIGAQPTIWYLVELE